jgi:hypothetical protein
MSRKWPIADSSNTATVKKNQNHGSQSRHQPHGKFQSPLEGKVRTDPFGDDGNQIGAHSAFRTWTALFRYSFWDACLAKIRTQSP